MSLAERIRRSSIPGLLALFFALEALFGGAAWVLLEGGDLDNPEAPLLGLLAVGFVLAVVGAGGARLIEARTARSSIKRERLAPACPAGEPGPRQEAGNESLFGAMVAHELKTPLAVVLAQTQQTLLRERDAADYKAALERCRRAALGMERRLGQILSLTRLEEEPKAGASVSEEICETCARVFADLAAEAEARGIGLRSDISGTGFPIDPALGELVLSNLVSNAIRHGKEGGLVRVEAAKSEGKLLVAVSDDGPGIPEAERSLLFGPLAHGRKQTASAAPGIRLGLAIVRKALASQGGSIDLRATGASGSRFEVWIPLPDTP